MLWLNAECLWLIYAMINGKEGSEEQTQVEDETIFVLALHTFEEGIIAIKHIYFI